MINVYYGFTRQLIEVIHNQLIIKAFKTFLLFVSFCLVMYNGQAQVGVGTNAPNPTAILDVSSNAKGVLVPRMTQAQKNAIVSPALGLLIFQTDNTTGFYYYNTGWVYISSVGPQGPAGKNTLVKTTSEPPGANCTTGGVKLEFGLDNNSNNVLDAAEIDASLTKYVCNGSTSGSFNHYIGEFFGGGVIFHLWKDAAAAEHGLIVAQTAITAGGAWSNVTTTAVGTASSRWNGLANCSAIVSQPAHVQSAAAQCLAFVSGGQTDWYLPSYAEMNLLWTNLFNVNKTLSTIGGATEVPLFTYWTSTEDNNSQAMGFGMFTGTPQVFSKSISLSIIAIRSF